MQLDEKADAGDTREERGKILEFIENINSLSI